MNRDIVPYLDDNIQLSIEEYRDKLYEVRTLPLSIQAAELYVLHFFVTHTIQSIVAKREELLQARAQVGGSDRWKVATESVEKSQQDSGDCLVQSVSEMDLTDREPLPTSTSTKPSSHPPALQKVTYTNICLCILYTAGYIQCTISNN